MMRRRIYFLSLTCSLVLSACQHSADKKTEPGAQLAPSESNLAKEPKSEFCHDKTPCEEQAAKADGQKIPPSGLLGAAFDSKETADLAEILKTPDKFTDKAYLISGVAQRVCKAAGCWMEISVAKTSEQSARVLFKDHAFFVPKDSAGQRVTVQGTVKSQKLAPSQVEHLKQDGAEFAAGDKAIKEIQIIATGVRFEKS